MASRPPGSWSTSTSAAFATPASRPATPRGTVAVDVLEADAARTRVRVTYDLTALSDAGRAWLAEFAAGYDAEIAEWEAAIAGATASAA